VTRVDSINLGGDYRYLMRSPSMASACPTWRNGVLTACDPDAGTWMFQAPGEVPRNQSTALDGYLNTDSLASAGVADPANPVPTVSG